MAFNPIHYRTPAEAIGNPESTRETDPDAATVDLIGLTRGMLYYMVNGISVTFAPADDAAFTVGTSKVVPVAGIYKSTRDSVDDGDQGAVAMTAKRGLFAVLETPNGDSVIDDTNDAVKIVHPVAGAGAVTALTQRATLASDDPAVTALQVIDDWDESDRAKVNVIAGQAGITAGAGAVAANTPRATLASDDPAVTALQVMDDWDESDRAKVNPIVGQAGVAGGSGTVGATTQRVVLATDVGLPAGTSDIGKIRHSLPTTSALTEVRVSYSATGDQTVVSATASQTTRVYKMMLNVAAATNVSIKDGAGTTLYTQQFLGAGTLILDLDGEPWFTTTANTALMINSSVAVQIEGRFYYVKSA